ncbi:sulfur carrier protein ThiS [Bacillus alveayuensis]|jgi:sulfur carrier protein|uniref:sulfur carrier protein ThiS n=1 Tax=Aeribacillus alveayuensis TaxID=279215 RepID=UPI0005D10E96|nr:sulfur carrier protein ThiS [Bacillus alveayuensis]
MKIQVNGKLVNIDDQIQTIADLLKHYQLENRIVVVELNREIINKEGYGSQSLHEGDQIEIVHFVGGG